MKNIRYFYNNNYLKIVILLSYLFLLKYILSISYFYPLKFPLSFSIKTVKGTANKLKPSTVPTISRYFILL